jgi:peptidoglycan/LPS O-acetylase OafA/YrhL
MEQNERQNNNFDFLRVFAALCITLTHSFNLLGLFSLEPLMKFTKNKIDFSFIGLCIFFSVSGFLIAKSADKSNTFLHYVWKRFLRIQPLLILVCLLTVFVVGPIFTTLSTTNYFNNLAVYSYFRNIMPIFGIQFVLPGVFNTNIGEAGINGSMWTLVVEERLYLLISLIFISKDLFKKFFKVFIVLLNILYVLHSAVFHKTLIPYLNGAHIFYAIIFLNAAAYYFFKIDFFKIPYKFTLIVILICFVIGLLYFKNEYSLLLTVIPFLILLFAHLKGNLNFTGKFGDLTYGIYIFSFPVQQIFIKLNFIRNNPYLLFVYTLLIVIPIAFFCWHLIEKKLMAKKNNFQ